MYTMYVRAGGRRPVPPATNQKPHFLVCGRRSVHLVCSCWHWDTTAKTNLMRWEPSDPVSESLRLKVCCARLTLFGVPYVDVEIAANQLHLLIDAPADSVGKVTDLHHATAVDHSQTTVTYGRGNGAPKLPNLLTNAP